MQAFKNEMHLRKGLILLALMLTQVWKLKHLQTISYSTALLRPLVVINCQLLCI